MLSQVGYWTDFPWALFWTTPPKQHFLIESNSISNWNLCAEFRHGRIMICWFLVVHPNKEANEHIVCWILEHMVDICRYSMILVAFFSDWSILRTEWTYFGYLDELCKPQPSLSGETSPQRDRSSHCLNAIWNSLGFRQSGTFEPRRKPS